MRSTGRPTSLPMPGAYSCRTKIRRKRYFISYFPFHRNRHKARKEAITNATVRLRSWNTEHPIDTDTGQTVSGAFWNEYNEHPFDKGHGMEVTWFPNDGSRCLLSSFSKFTEHQELIQVRGRAFVSGFFFIAWFYRANWMSRSIRHLRTPWLSTQGC